MNGQIDNETKWKESGVPILMFDKAELRSRVPKFIILL